MMNIGDLVRFSKTEFSKFIPHPESSIGIIIETYMYCGEPNFSVFWFDTSKISDWYSHELEKI